MLFQTRFATCVYSVYQRGNKFVASNHHTGQDLNDLSVHDTEAEAVAECYRARDSHIAALEALSRKPMTPQLEQAIVDHYESTRGMTEQERIEVLLGKIKRPSAQ